MPYYTDVAEEFISMICIYITDEEGRVPLFSSPISNCTLHITKQHHDKCLPLFPVPARCSKLDKLFASLSKRYRPVHVITSPTNPDEKVTGLKVTEDKAKQTYPPERKKKKNNGGAQKKGKSQKKNKKTRFVI